MTKAPATQNELVCDARVNEWGLHFIWAGVVIGVLIIPLFYVPGAIDAFRGPKEVLLIGQALVIAALVLGWPWRGLRLVRVPKVLLFVSAAVIWSAVASIFSTHRELSSASLARVAALALIFTATYWIASRKGLFAVAAVVLPGLINTLQYVASSWRRGTLFTIATQISDRPAAFLGNPNDIGAFLVLPALACAAATGLRQRTGIERMVWAICGVVLSAGVVATQTLLPLAALGVGVATMVALRWRRRAVAVFVILAVLIGVLIFTYEPLYTRLRLAVEAVKSGSLDSALSGRLLAFYAAMYMFGDRPLVGVGPGCFGLQYSEAKLRVVQDHPELLSSTAYGINFSEAHNDHLQMLAVAGLPGYALMLTALFIVGRISFRREDRSVTEQRRSFARMFALPLVTSFLVLAGAGFPLEIAATTLSTVFLSAVVVRWAE
ncbi:MAG: O-antigen ligase family protein [Thermoanaerobaculia bacterium]